MSPRAWLVAGLLCAACPKDGGEGTPQADAANTDEALMGHRVALAPEGKVAIDPKVGTLG